MLVVLRPAAAAVLGTDEDAPAVVVAGTRRLVVGAGAVGRGGDVEKEGATDEDAPVPLMITRCDRQGCRERTGGIATAGPDADGSVCGGTLYGCGMFGVHVVREGDRGRKA
jgi:hypothetical protein